MCRDELARFEPGGEMAIREEAGETETRDQGGFGEAARKGPQDQDQECRQCEADPHGDGNRRIGDDTEVLRVEVEDGEDAQQPGHQG